MIKIKKAPAGYIAQLYEDEERPYAGVPNQEYRDNHFLFVTGKWCPTFDEAIRSVKSQRLKEIKKLQKKIAQLKAKVDEYETLLIRTEKSSDTVFEEK